MNPLLRNYALADKAKADAAWRRATNQPIPTTPTGIERLVCEMIAERQAKGIAKYGMTVSDNPLDLRAWLQHALEETLDQAIYLRRAIAEIDRDVPDCK